MKVRNRNYSVPFARPVAEKKTISSDFLSTRRNSHFFWEWTALRKKQTVDVSQQRIGGVYQQDWFFPLVFFSYLAPPALRHSVSNLPASTWGFKSFEFLASGVDNCEIFLRLLVKSRMWKWFSHRPSSQVAAPQRCSERSAFIQSSQSFKYWGWSLFLCPFH